MLNKRWIVGLAILLAVGSLFATRMTFEDSWGHRGYNLISSTANGVEIIFSVDLMRLVETKIDGKTMYTVTIPGCFMQNNEGAPNLSGVGRYIAIPQGARAEATIINKRTEVIENVDIAPAPVIPLDSDDSPIVYKKDQRIYKTDAYYPASPVILSESKQMRGVDYVIINICPFQYNPVTKKLIIYKDLRVKVDFIGGNGHFGADRLRNRFWEPILEGHLINYSILPKVDLYSGYDQGDIDYAIIVPDDANHEAWADTIMNWRKKQGIYTEVYTLSQIGGNNATQIQNFIDSLYNNHNLVAFLLLSDYQSSGFAYGITTQFYSGCASDNMYADENGDHLPDMYHGRFTTHDNTHLSRMVGKLLSYERNPSTNPRTYNCPLFACGWQQTRWFQLCTEIVKCYMDSVLGKTPKTQYKVYSGSPSPGSSWSSNTNTYMLIDYFGPSGLGYIEPTNPHTYTYWDTGTANGINREVNDGTFILQHRDHGWYDGWSEPSYKIPNLPGLNNDDYPYVFSINCLTGCYNYSSATFAESLHRHNKGAVGVLAASETSYSFVNDTYVFGYYDCMHPDFMPDYPTYDAEPNYWYGNLRPGYGNVYGKYFLQQSNWPYNPSSKTITYHLFHHHTDVFLTLYSEVPDSLTVVHDPELTAGVTIFTVTANDSSEIALTVLDEIIGIAEGTGSPVDITIPPQTEGDTMLVTVTLHNYFRYEKKVPVTAGPGITEEPAIRKSRVWFNQTVVKNQLIINYALAKEQDVKVSFFDATGRMVREYVNGKLSGAGSLRCNTNGIAAGIYFVRIENGSDASTKQIVVVR